MKSLSALFFAVLTGLLLAARAPASADERTSVPSGAMEAPVAGAEGEIRAPEAKKYRLSGWPSPPPVPPALQAVLTVAPTEDNQEQREKLMAAYQASLVHYRASLVELQEATAQEFARRLKQCDEAIAALETP